jgi:hypothetical protein
MPTNSSTLLKINKNRVILHIFVTLIVRVSSSFLQLLFRTHWVFEAKQTVRFICYCKKETVIRNKSLLLLVIKREREIIWQ